MRRALNMLLIALAVICADWLSKLWAQESLFVVFNDRAPAFWPVPVLLAVTLLLSVSSRDPLLVPAMGLLSGGWMANFIDRAFFGPVTDFIRLPLPTESVYYANVADVAIVISLVLTIAIVVRSMIRTA